MRTPGFVVVVLAVLAATLPGAASAQSVTGKGSTLAAPANYPYHCDYRWTAGYNSEPGAFGPGGQQEYTPTYIGPSTCSLYNIGARGNLASSHLVPGTGTVKVARVKSGPNPAPVSIGTVRLYTGRDQQGNLQTTCCLGVSETPVVNPTPNAVTEIPVGFRVETQLYDPNVPGRVGFNDIVVVNVHGSTGTLPMADLGGPKPLVAPDGDPGAVWYFPKFNPSENNQNQWTANGFEVLMNYDWCPAASARQAGGCSTAGTPLVGGQAPTTPKAPKTPTVVDPKTRAAIRSTKLRLKGTSAAVTVACTQAAPCAGSVRLRTRTGKAVLLASKKVSVAGGKTATVKLVLSAKNRKRVTKKGLKVRAEIDLGTAGKVTRNLTLKR